LKLVRRAAALLSLLAGVTALAVAAPATHPAKPVAAAPAPASAPANPSAGSSDEALDAVAAMVNDEAVLVSDVEEQVYLFMQQLQQSGQNMPDSAQVDTLRHQFLEKMIDDRVLQAEAKRQGITVTDDEVEKQVDNAIDQARARMGGEQGFEDQLKRENLTETQLRDKYRTDLRKELAVDRLKQKEFPRRTVTQAEAESYFLAHKDKFPKVPKELRLQVIQIPPQADSVATAAGLVKILALRKRVVGGEKFAKVAGEASEDPGSATAGGDLGFFTRGRMDKSFEDAAFSLKLNEISQPVRSAFGWHLIQVLERDTVKTVAGKDSLGDDGKPMAEVHARHILVRVTPTPADVQRWRAIADHVRDEAAKGTNFTTLVHRYSHYTGPADADGDVGFVSLNSLQPQIRVGLDSLEVGEVSEVLPNQTGFNIFKVLDRHAEREYTVDEIRNELPDAVAQVQLQEKLDAWVKTLRAKAQIEYRQR